MLAFIRRWQMRRAFSRYLTPAAIDRMMSGNQSSAPEHANRAVFFLLAQVHDDEVAETVLALDHALYFTEALLDKNVFQFTEVLGSLFLVTFGHHEPVTDLRDVPITSPAIGHGHLTTCADQLLAEFKDKIRIVTGETDARIGNVGGKCRRLRFQAQPAYLGMALQQLTSIAYGTRHDMKRLQPRVRPFEVDASQLPSQT
jgi:hypothetical protein